MILEINEKINNTVKMLTEGLQIWIDFDKPDAVRGRGDIRYEIYLSNFVNGKHLNKNQRTMIQPFQLSEGQKFDFEDLKNFFISQNPQFEEFRVEVKPDWIP